MFKLAVRALLLAVVLAGGSLVFADELMVTALILVTIGFATVTLIMVPDAVQESSNGHTPSPADSLETSVTARQG